jgi:adenosylhomocysteine nucleosidase
MVWAACLFAAPAMAAPDATPRTAIISAFEPEYQALRGAVSQPAEQVFAGTRFVTGTMSGRPVLLFQSGMSMVNAAMATQLALDHFRVTRIVFSGIAGGIDPGLDVGDVVVPDRWAQYLEATFARAEGDHFAPPAGNHYAMPDWPNYGMIYPRAVEVRPAGSSEPERRQWFEADPALLATARKAVAKTVLGRCVAALCLRAQPRLVVGGAGISGPVFMDNAQFRAYAFRTFHAQVLDMETAAVAQVAYINRVPFIGFRSLSDLAGGDPGENQAPIFFRLASENSAAVVRAFVAALPPG